MNLKQHVLFLFLLLSRQVFCQLDTIQKTEGLQIVSEFKGSTFPLIFEAAFFDSTETISFGNNLKFSTEEIGKIKIETGKIIVGDPITMSDAEPYKQVFPIGNFPVELAYSCCSNGKSVAYSRIKFSNQEVMKWTFALFPDQAEINLIDTTFYCFGVDAGMAIFIDEKVNMELTKRNAEWYLLFNKMEQVNYTGFIHSFENRNLAMFSTGYGDGCYGVYIGLDKDNKICRLLVDFAIVNWWDSKS